MRSQAVDSLRRVLACCAALLAGGGPSHGAPRSQTFSPPSRSGPGVLMVSGQTGSAAYASAAQSLAAKGFVVVLVDGNDVFGPRTASQTTFQEAVATVQAAPGATPGRIGVVGFSLGGGAALRFAARMPDRVAAVVAIYPFTGFDDPQSIGRQVRVPTLVLAGVRDTYRNCCLIGSARALEAAGKPTVALVEYPDAAHGFALRGPTFRAGDTADALSRAGRFLNSAL